MHVRIALWLGFISVCFAPAHSAEPTSQSGLAPWKANTWYWARDGKPVLLLGGSDDDNLFQWPEDKLLPQLDRIVEAGGNVIRNTMSDRKDRGFETYPFLQRDDGKYDLRRWNPEYWDRFERLLSETAKRDIVVQIEVWDRFDYTDSNDSQRWQNHPYNPKNNVNYSFAESGFARRYPDHPGANKQPFFFTTPRQRDNTVVLEFQERFVNKMLDHSLRYNHVLYCIDNETRAEPEWGRHWAEFIKRRAQTEQKRVMVTEMWDDWDLTAARHRQTFDHPELYDYVDVSQNNHNSGQRHWDNFLHVRRYLAKQPRPMNTTKTYGADGNKFHHTDQDAIERFWRHLLAGAASIRFHRPDSGLGINDKAFACIRAARLLEQQIPLWTVEPANDLIGERQPNEAYAAASDERDRIVVFLPAAKRIGEVTLDLKGIDVPLALQWIDIDRGTSAEAIKIGGNGVLTLRPPESGNFVAAITPRR